MILAPATFQLPRSMSEGAPPVDDLYMDIYWFSMVFTVVITVSMVYFILKYRRKKGVRAERTKDLTKLELFWTITPLAFIVVLFHIGFETYIKNATAAENAMEIRVRAKKWSWEFEYPTGSREAKELYLPVNQPVKFVISSDDVLHSFYIREFRLKRDAVPGLYSYIAAKPTELGDAQVFCAEYCGTSHSDMLATVHVVTEEEYKKHLDEMDKMPEKCGDSGNEACTPALWGRQLFVKNGCPTCHSVDGTKGNAPSLKGVFATMQPLQTGDEVMADENYVRESILRPQAKIVRGFTNIQMPTFVFKDPQVDALIAYVKSLK
jgi:cytochrome c oxidase subunit 2